MIGIRGWLASRVCRELELTMYILRVQLCKFTCQKTLSHLFFFLFNRKDNPPHLFLCLIIEAICFTFFFFGLIVKAILLTFFLLSNRNNGNPSHFSFV